MRTATTLATALLTLGFAARPAHPPLEGANPLGAFSISLTVKDIAASRAFYEKLGFSVVGGEQAQKWLVLENGTTKVGIFQGMFERNMLTFNPGWDDDKQPLASFEDVRALQHRFKEAGLTPTMEADESSTGPAFFTLTDPDGNPLLFDQFVDKPAAEKR